MTQYFNDFSQYTLGSFPSDWLAYTGATDGSGGVGDQRNVEVVDLSADSLGAGQALKFDDPTNSGTHSRLYIWDAVPTGADLEIYFEFILDPQGTPTNAEAMGIVRNDFTTLPTRNWYQGGVRGTDLDLNKYIGDTFSNLNNDTVTDWSAPAGTWQYCRLRINGTTLSVKIWDEGETEPGSFQVTDTDTDLASGRVGIGTIRNQPFYIRAFGAGTGGDAAPTESVTATPTITDINTNNEVIPGTTATLTGTNLTGATGFNIGSEAQTDFTVVSDTSITFTTVRGGNPYNQNLTGTLLHPDGNATITVQQVPESGTFAVTAASPNTTDDASLWTGLIDTATSNPITIVDGDQAWVKNPNNLTNLAIAADGAITADQTGDFVVQIWLQSEGVWGSDQTVTFDTLTPPASTPGSGRRGFLRAAVRGTVNSIIGSIIS